jgi:hypothetical protein
VAFGLLCVVAGSRWIVADRWPELGSTLRSEACACGGLALLALTFAVVRRHARLRLRAGVWLSLAGIGLLAMPAFGSVLRGAAAESLNRTVALCFVPVMVTVLMGVWRDGSAASLWPGLAGLGGALLIFPLALPSSVWGYVGLLMPPLAVSAACAALPRGSRRIGGAWAAAALLVGGTLGLWAIEGARMASGGSAGAISACAVGLDGLEAALTVLAVLQRNELRYASRYFAVPLVSVLEGVALLRSGITIRLAAGLFLLAAGTAAFWWRRDTPERAQRLHLT